MAGKEQGKGDWRTYMEEARGCLESLKNLIDTGLVSNEVLLEELVWVKEKLCELKQRKRKGSLRGQFLNRESTLYIEISKFIASCVHRNNNEMPASW